MRKPIAIATLILSLAACRNPARHGDVGSGTAKAAEAGGPSLTPEQLGELGARIRQSPGDAPRLLAQRGLTAESFEAQIRAVTENAEASKRYSASYAASAARATP